MGWDPYGVRETIGMVATRPMRGGDQQARMRGDHIAHMGVTKRPIRKVYLAHVRTGARPTHFLE